MGLNQIDLCVTAITAVCKACAYSIGRFKTISSRAGIAGAGMSGGMLPTRATPAAMFLIPSLIARLVS
jgi:hypothetical protein